MPSEYDEQRDSTDTQLPGEYDLFDLMGVRLEKGNYPTLSAFFAQMATD